jgi:hypothetical protein
MDRMSTDTTFTRLQLLQEARDLLSEDGENPEYDRAIVELVTRLLPDVTHDDHDRVEFDIRTV